ncbi:MAG: hypothetical protein LBU48_00955 [Coriobacteriales bacterium]|jgi:hypothetical protein|nr:hypothetical protein [Coriobacteriales bacterium]
MTKLVDYVEELTQEIGPRPAGTEAEHRASILIANHLADYGLDVSSEEFTCARNVSWVRILYYALGVASAGIIFTHVVPILAAFVIAWMAVILLGLEVFGKNPLYRLFSKNLSQNVVAKYVPAGTTSRHKVVVVAHYDTARAMIQAAPALNAHYALLHRIVWGALAGLLVLTLVQVFPVPDILRQIFEILTLLPGIIVLLALLFELINLIMPYNQGANCNGSSVAVLFGIAERLTSGAEATGISLQQTTPRRKVRSSRTESDNKKPRGKAARAEKGVGDMVTQQPSQRYNVRKRGEDPAENPDAGAPETAVDAWSASAAAQAGAAALVAAGAGVSATDATQDLGKLTAQLDAAAQTASPSGGSASKGQPGSPIKSVGDNLAQPSSSGNPFVTVRPPLSETEEQQRAAKDERARQLKLPEKRNADGTPAWFTKAKQAAERNAERKEHSTDERTVVRSRFADVPLTGTPRAASPAEALAGENPAAGSVDAAAQSAATAATAAAAKQAAAPRATTGTAAQAAAPAAAAQGGTTNAAPARATATAAAGATATAKAAAAADLSGLDRSAFKVVPGSDPAQTALILPVHDEDEDDISDEHQIADDTPFSPAHAASSSASSPLNRLRDLPSVQAGQSERITQQQLGLDTTAAVDDPFKPLDSSVINLSGAFAPLSATGVMKPIGEELLAYHEDDDVFITDTDDSLAVEHYSSAHAAHGAHVAIPNSRLRSFFGSVGDRLSGKKKEKFESTPSSWLGVDEHYNPRKEGSAIGSWDNFSEDEDDGWQGGAFGGSSRLQNVDALIRLSEELLDKEVWLVALGARESKNAGIKAFIKTHASELKGALLINLEGVGRGDLSYTTAEGSGLKPIQTDRRLQNLVSASGDAVGWSVDPVVLDAYASDASYALAEGTRAISLVGMRYGEKLPQGWRWSDDTTVVLEENNLQAATSIVIETIKSS